MNSSNYEIVPSSQLKRGDVLLGLVDSTNGYNPLTHSWEVVTDPELSVSGLFSQFNLRSTFDGQVVANYRTVLHTLWAIRVRELKYDPMQQGDKDDDI